MLAIDFGARSIKAVHLVRTGNSFKLENFGLVLTPPDSIKHGEIKDADAVSEALMKMLRKKGIREKNGIIGITGQKVIVREITTPLMNEKELIDGIQWEAPKYVPYDLKESLLDAKIIEELEEREGNKMMRVLLVAAPKTLVSQQIDIIRKNRIQPKVVDIIANAQIRAFQDYLIPVSVDDQETKIDIIISMGATTTEITLIEGDRLKFTRTILKGGNDITEAIAKKLEINFNEAEILKRKIGVTITPALDEIETNETEEQDIEKEDIKKVNEEDIIPEKEILISLINEGVTDIFNEIRKSLNYYKTQYQNVSYQRIILTGGMAAMSNLGQLLKQQFRITVVKANPLKDITINNNINLDNLEKYKSSLANAIGLAKRER